MCARRGDSTLSTLIAGGRLRRIVAPARFKGIVFDFDGTLLRSMENHHAAYAHVFAKYGHEVVARDVYMREGKRAEEVIYSLMEAKGLGAEKHVAEELARMKGEFFRALTPPEWYPGGGELVESLHASDYRLAVATGTTRANVDHLIGERVRFFEAIVTADDVTHAKPDPEPYLRAFEFLGIAPKDALVVENAPLGVASGKAAGATVVAILSTVSREDLHEADHIVATIADVARIIKNGVKT